MANYRIIERVSSIGEYRYKTQKKIYFLGIGFWCDFFVTTLGKTRYAEYWNWRFDDAIKEITIDKNLRSTVTYQYIIHNQ